MSIIITPNEVNLIDVFKKLNVPYQLENLLIGDIHIRKDEKTIYILERKAKGDLDASIKDGRYKEQKARLIESGISKKNIIYIIENLQRPPNDSCKKRVWSAICNTQHRDGFTIFPTKNIDETVNYLKTLADSVTKFTQASYNESSPPSETEKVVNINIKKSQIAKTDWFKYSLTLIPSCSINIATIITEQYPTVNSLLTAIREGGVDCLKDLKHGASNRRIGQKLSSVICQTLLDNF